MIDNDFQCSVDDTADEVIMTTTKMQKITKMSIVYTMMMQSEDLAELAELWPYYYYYYFFL